MPRSAKKASRSVALCYIRQSFTRDENDVNSPERQRANIENIVEHKGWTPEWYEDVGGHKSGRKEDNRPEWLKLKARLSDPDVVALVANDMSRLHRKGWRVGDLVDHLERYGVALVLAAPGREVDTSTPMGRMFLQFGAIIDEYYADDISQRAKDSVQYRKKRGITIGRPPFGTVRNEQGHLVPSEEGGWLLPDGQYAAGTKDEAPDEGAIWRGFYECAQTILTLYADANIGAEKIAYKLDEEGWPYRDRKGKPRAIKREDVRRVLANWPEYGGLVLDKKAKDRPAYSEPDIDERPLIEERAVFPVKLLQKVARLRSQRSRKPLDNGIKRGDYPYPLAGILRCEHCARLADQHNDPSRITRLGGTNMNGKRRYRHQAGVSCGCTNKSVPCDRLHEDFGRLLHLMTLDVDAAEQLQQLALTMNMGAQAGGSGLDPEVERQQQIALAKRKLDAAIHLYSEALIDADDFAHRRQALEREIAHWESWTSETERMRLELTMCIEAVEKLAFIWDHSEDEDRKGFVQHLFEWVEYDLDARRITQFQLKPWADRFIILRGALYDLEDAGNDDDVGPEEGGGQGKDSGAKKQNASPKEVKQAMPHRGLYVISFQNFDVAMDYAITHLYSGQNNPSVLPRERELRQRTRTT